MNEVNILLCGNGKVFDGTLSLLVSALRKTKRILNVYIYTMDATRLNPNYTVIDDKMIKYLNKVVKSYNKNNKVTKIDVTDIYNKEFLGCPNEGAYCTPYTLLRLLADLVPNMPHKLLYLDIDMMFNQDISLLYDIDVSDVEYAAVKEKYGKWVIRPDYINAGMLLMNLKYMKETKVLEHARERLRKKKYLFADQSALFFSTTKKKLINRKFNEQRYVNRKSTVLCHFSKRLLLFPYFKTENYKQWNIDEIHKYLNCHMFDSDLEEYKRLKEDYLNE